MHYVVYETSTNAFLRGTGFDPRIPDIKGDPRMKEGESVIEVEDAVWIAANDGHHKFHISEGSLVVELDMAVAVAAYDEAVEQHLLETRTARGYTVREPSYYLNSTVPRWRQDALDWVAFLDACMLYGLNVQNTYASTGTAPSLEEFKANLPQITWTYVE